MSASPFLNPDPKQVFYEGRSIIGLWDAYPVSPGHALLVTRRLVTDWFEATPDERAELFAAVDVARSAICERYQPDGFNIGVNVGEAAGQTIAHLHLHVIPRYKGDVADPRGGIRQVIPGKGNYLLSESRPP